MKIVREKLSGAHNLKSRFHTVFSLKNFISMGQDKSKNILCRRATFCTLYESCDDELNNNPLKRPNNRSLSLYM